MRQLLDVPQFRVQPMRKKKQGEKEPNKRKPKKDEPKDESSNFQPAQEQDTAREANRHQPKRFAADSVHRKHFGA